MQSLFIFFLNFMSSTANRVIKNSGYLYAKMGITMFISLYTTRLILNSLGASDFGIFNIVGGAIAMLGFLNAAMASATQRFMSYSEGEGNKEKQKSIFNVSFVLHLGISFVVGIALLIAGYFFFNGILNIPADRVFAAKVVYGSLIVSTMFTVMTVPYDAAMNAHENMKYYAIVGIFESFLKLAVAFACVYTTFDKLIVYGSLMACIPLITLTIMRVYCHRHYEECVIVPRRYWNKGLMKEMTSFAGWGFLINISSMLSNYGNGIILNHFWGTTLNAAQGIGNQLNGQLMTFSNNMIKAINPVIAKTEGEGKREMMLKASCLGCKYSFYLLAFFGIPFIIETPYILKLWLHNVPEWTVTFFRFELLRSLLGQLIVVLQRAIDAEGHIKNYSILRSLSYFLPFPLLIVAFSFQASPSWMYIIWIFCSNILGGGIVLYYCKKNCGLSIKYYMSEVIHPCFILFTVCILVSSIPSYIILMESSFIRLMITCIISTGTFITLFFLYGIGKEERLVITNVLKTIKNK